MKKAAIDKIDENTWRFTESVLGEKVYCYLLEGGTGALLIDTAYGFTDIPKAIRQLTDKPLTVVNTHGHFDHISGNYLYPRVHMSLEDREVYARHSRRSTIEDILKEAKSGITGKLMVLLLSPLLSKVYSHPFPETEVLPEEGYFDLGGRKIRIIPTPGHTGGSISLLDENNHWLFSGDTCGDAGMLLQFPESTSVKSFHKTIKTLLEMVESGEVIRNYPGHQTTPAPVEKMKYYDQLLNRLEKGDLTQEEWKQGIIREGSISIQFNPERIRKEIA